MNLEINQLKRNSLNESRLQKIEDVRNLLIQSNYEERIKFENCRNLLLKFAEIIPLSKNLLQDAIDYEKSPYDLRPQDAIVYASIISNLTKKPSLKNCFLNRNSRDFDLPEITEELKNLNCKMIPRFDDGYNFIVSKTTNL